MVADDVVQVPGDAQALLGDPAAGLLLTIALRAAGSFLHGGQIGLPAARGVAGGHGEAAERDHCDVL